MIFNGRQERSADKMYHEYRIKLSGVDDAREFVKMAGDYNFDIDIFYNRVIVDAKSILGVLSLDLSNILTVQCNVKNEKFENEIQKYCVA